MEVRFDGFGRSLRNSIRIETKAGHGAGKPTGKVIDEAADRFAFLVKVLGVPVQETPV